MKNKLIIQKEVIRALKIDLYAEYWNCNPKTFKQWSNHLKEKGIYRKLSYLLSKWIPNRNDKNFDITYKEISNLIGFNHFIGMKREQAAAATLKNWDYTDIQRARDLKKKYDINYKIDLFAINSNDIQCAFQVKGGEGFKYTDAQKLELFNSMKKINEEIPTDKFFLIIVPEQNTKEPIKLINLNEGDKDIEFESLVF